MAKKNKLRQIRVHDNNTKALDSIREQLPLKPTIEALANSAMTLGIGIIAKTNKLALP